MWWRYNGGKYFIVINKLYMKIISRSHLCKAKRHSLPNPLQEEKQKSLAYCCEMGEEPLGLTHFSKSKTDPNTTIPFGTMSPLHDTTINGSLTTNTQDSKLVAKEWKVQLNCRILSVTEIIGEKKAPNSGRSNNTGQSVCKRQKLEVSLSKRNKQQSPPPPQSILLPRLSELGRDRPFLKSFTRGGKIVDSV